MPQLFKWFIYLFFFTYLNGSVVPNPFLKPGSNQKRPAPAKPVFKPKPLIRPNVANELEFKGYFIIKGQVFLSLFNKKVNHGEWVTIGEKTYEEFSAEKFDLESETLTILYEGQSFDLSLIGPKASSGAPSLPSKNPVLTKQKPNLNQSSSPRFMPPKPKSNPVIPAFLVNKPAVNPFSSTGVNPSSTSSSASGIRSRISGLPYPGFVPRRTNPENPTSIVSTPNQGQTISSSKGNSGINSSNANQFSNSIPTTENNKGTTNNSNNEIDLDSLPPPPPPPNILPPSPPPNLVPSRDD